MTSTRPVRWYQLRRRRAGRWGRRRWLAALAGWLLVGPSPAAPLDHSRLVARVKFLTAEAVLAAGDRSRFDAIAAELADYPLYPYLLELRLRAERPAPSAAQYARARAALADTRLASGLERRWLRHLANTEQWAQFLTHYAPPHPADLRCHHARALLAQGRSRDAFEAARPLWLVGKSQHAACDPVFASWREQGLPYELVRSRLHLAFDRGTASLVAYLRRYLEEDDRRLADVWLELRDDPSKVLAHADSQSPAITPLIEAALRRSAYRDPRATLALWEQVSAQRALDPGAVAPHLALALFRHRNHAKAFEWFSRLPPEPLDDGMREARVINAMVLERWEQALAWMDELAPAEQASEKWRYWRGRALAALGRHAAASEAWSPLTRERSYYGYLAADRIGAPYRFNDRPLVFDPSAFARVRASDAFQRARELRALGRLAAFRAEWRFLLRHLEIDLGLAAALAHEEGWHSEAILTLAQSGELDALAIRFPVLYEGLLRVHGERNGLSLAWLLATVRQESAFMQDVRSHAGALGLMQIMPATGQWLAQRLDIRPFHPERLLEPSLNVRLGATYLRELLDEFAHPLLASAAYNAGRGRVRHWRPAERAISADLWVETIPFRETRQYVQRVAYYQVIYAQRLGGDPVRLADLFDRVVPAAS